MRQVYIAIGALVIGGLPFNGIAQHKTLHEYLSDTNRISIRDSIRIAKAKANRVQVDSVPKEVVIDKYMRYIDIISPHGEVEGFAKSIEVLAFEKVIGEKVETFMLRNNTPYLMSDITLRFVYKTPDDSLMISYRDVVLPDEILPLSTKRYSIESFDTYKRYFYIDNPLKDKENGLPFSIHIELLDYKIAITPENYSTLIDEE